MKDVPDLEKRRQRLPLSARICLLIGAFLLGPALKIFVLSWMLQRSDSAGLSTGFSFGVLDRAAKLPYFIAWSFWVQMFGVLVLSMLAGRLERTQPNKLTVSTIIFLAIGLIESVSRIVLASPIISTSGSIGEYTYTIETQWTWAPWYALGFMVDLNVSAVVILWLWHILKQPLEGNASQ